MIVKQTGNDFRSVAAGTHIARCVGLVGIGTREKEWQGKKRLASEVVVMWELPHEIRDDDKPFTISAFYTRSLSEKANLRHALTNWRGKEFTVEELQAFDIKNVLDKGCQVVCSEKNDKVRVTSVAGLPKGIELPARVHELTYFDAEEFNREAYDKLSDGMKKLVSESFEYAEFQQYGEVKDSNERLIEWQAAQNGPQFSGQPTNGAGGFNPSTDSDEYTDPIF